MSLFSELKRRNVLRMAALYVVAAWLVIQVAGALIDLNVLPASLGPWVVVLLVIGFPIALVVSWFYELSPEGLSLDTDASVSDTATPIGGRRMDFVIIAVLSAALLMFAYDKWWVPEPPDQSVAVLPFDNMSGDPDQEYFSDGLSDTLIHMLTQVSQLKVTAKTSSFYFKGKNIDVREIGRQLSVGTILEGSVQKAGDRVRVIAQLIRAEDGTHLWSKSFDRDLEDYFDVQDEIALEVVAALKVTLLETEENRLTQRYEPTTEAYDELIRGRHEMEKRTASSLADAERHFKRAIELDPDYALAYVNLVMTYRLQWVYGGESRNKWLQLGQPLIEKALELDPLSGEALLQGAILCTGQAEGAEQLSSCREDLVTAIELNPNTDEARYWYSEWLSYRGQFEEALARARVAAELDPMSPIVQYRVAMYAWRAGHAEEAILLLQRNIERNPEFPNNYHAMARNKARLGHLGEAQWWRSEHRKRNPGDVYSWGLECVGYLNLGDVVSAEQCANLVTEAHPDTNSAMLWSTLRRYKGEWERGIAILESWSESNPMSFHLRALLADWVGGQGDVERARRIMTEAFPELLEDEVDLTGNYTKKDWDYAIVFAVILHANGEARQRDVLLLAVERHISTMHRVHFPRYGIADVYIHVMRGDRGRAIAALREAVDEGWGAYFDLALDGAWWTLRDDWKLRLLHDDPEFIAIMDELEARVAAQRQWYEENKDKPLF